MQIFPGKQIALNRIRDMEISTVELPRMPGDDQVRYETCIFYDNSLSEVVDHYALNEVVDQYSTEEEAHRAHNSIVERELTKFIKLTQENDNA
jgi:hypothetical protein